MSADATIDNFDYSQYCVEAILAYAKTHRTGKVAAATPGSYDFIEMPVPPRPRKG
jgi:hypothetical protein